MRGGRSGPGRLWAGLALCLLLSGCGCTFAGNLPVVKPLKTVRSHRFSQAEAICIPAALAADLRLRVEEGRAAYEDFTPVERAVPAPVLGEEQALDEDSRFYAVDFDNDGQEDLFSYTRRGMGAAGIVRWTFRPGGGREASYYQDVSMTTPIFIAWEGKNYLLSLFQDPESDAVLSVTVFAGGWPAEELRMSLDPADERITETIFREFTLIS